MLDFLCRELQDYVARLYGILPADRIFHITKSYTPHKNNQKCIVNWYSANKSSRLKTLSDIEEVNKNDKADFSCKIQGESALWFVQWN